jgi:hypothetical protein
MTFSYSVALHAPVSWDPLPARTLQLRNTRLMSSRWHKGIRSEVLRAMDMAPELTRLGLGIDEACPASGERRRELFAYWREQLLEPYSLAEFDRARQWLAMQARTRTVRRFASSRELKLMARAWWRHTHGEDLPLSTGSFLAAALAGGFQLRRCDPTSPHAYLDISRSRLLETMRGIQVDTRKRPI